MIKNLLTTVLTSAVIVVSAQQLPNSGFENWTSGNPTGWGSADDMLSSTGLISGTTLETQVSPGNSGSSACELKTQTVTLLLVGSFDVPGIVNSGPLTLDLASGAPSFGRIPYTAMPSGYSFYYKYAPVNGDTAATICYFTKWNSSTNSRDTVGGGGTLINGTTSGFTMLTVPITWAGTTAPDSVQMFFLSSAGAAPQINTSLIIDDINMIVPIGMNEQVSVPFSVFPNPATDHVNIVCKDNRASKVEVYDFTGKRVAFDNFVDSKVRVNTESLPGGVYIYRVIDSNGKELRSSKFSVAK
ncbi:MAG: T9SS type A sorting domain-containing protein [Bacteroidota bacterium]|jgi:hypothetical protein